jgi:hypothetical protein
MMNHQYSKNNIVELDSFEIEDVVGGPLFLLGFGLSLVAIGIAG